MGAKVIAHNSRNTYGPGPSRSGWQVKKMWSDPNKMEVLFNFCFYNFLPSHMVEAAEPPQPRFGPLDPRIKVKSKSRRLKPDQVNYWEGALQLLYIR